MKRIGVQNLASSSLYNIFDYTMLTLQVNYMVGLGNPFSPQLPRYYIHVGTYIMHVKVQSQFKASGLGVLAKIPFRPLTFDIRVITGHGSTYFDRNRSRRLRGILFTKPCAKYIHLSFALRPVTT